MTAMPDRLASAFLDRYRLERELGAGGMATVYLAHDLRHDRAVAIKVLHEDLGATLGPERFLAEIRTTARLQHPHILPLLDSGEAGGRLFYVMPYVDGETLRSRLTRETQLPIEDAVRIAREVADALGYAHGHGIVHRDVKPENILLQGGHALVADFGIALAVQQAGGARLTQTGLSLGTPQYMAPEQAMGEKVVDHRADVYALGAVTYEMLTGEPPFTGATVQAIVAKVLSSEPARPTTIRKTIPPNVEAAVLRALAKLPADRFATAEGMADAMSAADDTTTRVAVLPAGNARSVPRRGIWIAIAALLGLIAMSGWYRIVTSPPLPVERIPIALHEPPRARSTNDPSVEISNDGRLLMYLANGGHRVLDLRTGQASVLSSERVGISAAFSPSGDSAVIRSASWLGQLWVIERPTGRATFLVDSAFNQVRWADDGWVYFRDLKQGLRRVRPSDGRREVLLERNDESEPVAENPEPVPGTSAIVFTRRKRLEDRAADAELVLLERPGATQRVLTRGIHARFATSGYLLFVRADGTLFGSAFDRSALRLTGPTVRLLDSVTVLDGGYLRGAFDVSGDGSLVYVKDAPLEPDTLAFLDGRGATRGIDANWGGWIRTIDHSTDGKRWTASLNRSLRLPTLWVREDGKAAPRPLAPGPMLDVNSSFVGPEQVIAFVSPRDGGNWDLYRVPFDGSASPARILDRVGDIQGPRFSKSGEWVAFCERGNLGEQDVYVYRFGRDSTSIAVATSPAQECNPDISPDGRTVAYESNEASLSDIYVRRPSTAEPARRVSLEGGRSPRFARDGRALFFEDARHRIVAVNVDQSSGLPAGDPEPLFALDPRDTWLGMNAHGEFIVRRGGAQAPGQVVLIRQFSKLLRERLR